MPVLEQTARGIQIAEAFWDDEAIVLPRISPAGLPGSFCQMHLSRLHVVVLISLAAGPLPINGAPPASRLPDRLDQVFNRLEQKRMNDNSITTLIPATFRRLELPRQD